MSQHPVTAVSRKPGHLDLFTVRDDGRVFTTWWTEEGGWSDSIPIGGFFPPGARIAAVARTPDNLDLFVCGNDGRVYTSWWFQGAAGWSGVADDWAPIGGFFPPGAPLSATSRAAGNIDVFVTGNDGRVYTSWWYAGNEWSGVRDNWASLGGFFPPGSPVAAVARSARNLDLFITGDDGRVYTSWWYEGAPDWWSGIHDNWTPIGGFFPAGAPVAGVSRTAGNLDLFVTGNDGRVYTSWWYDGAPSWSGVADNWVSIGGFFPVAGPLSAVARAAGNLDVFVVGNDGFPYTSWWFNGAPSWSGVADNWMPIDHRHERTFRGRISSGGLAALGGWGEVTVREDGSSRWGGHAHDSGADGYNFGVSATLSDRVGHVLAFAHHGHVGGTFTPGSRNHNWDEQIAPNPVIAAHFREFSNGEFGFSTNYSSDFASAAEGALSLLAKWVLGSTPVGAAVGLVVFIGVEVGSLISTGSLVPGARVVGGVLWLAGPSNTLLALAAEGVAAAGSRERELTIDEYDFADRVVFHGTLPPRDRIVLTDTIGGGDRAFTFPRFDGKITINMGSDCFGDPRSYHVSHPDLRKRRAYGEVFVHELVHAWQIAHTSMDLALLGDALASKVCEISGGNPYAYGAAGPDYGSFNLEQQAQIVSDWFAGRNGSPASDPASSYFTYVLRNIRTGQL